MRLPILFATIYFSISAGFAQPLLSDHIVSNSQLLNFGKTVGSSPVELREIPTVALALIKDFEGWEPSPYNDAAGYCTIGFGHLLAKERCELSDLSKAPKLLSVEQGTALLQKDLNIAQLAVQSKAVVKLTNQQYGALVSFTFNVGADNFAKSRLLEFVNLNRHDLAARQFRRWVNAKGKKIPGLVARRACEETLYAGALSFGPSGKFDRSVCRSLGAAGETETLIDIYTGE